MPVFVPGDVPKSATSLGSAVIPEVKPSSPEQPGWAGEPPHSKSSWCVCRISIPMLKVCLPLFQSRFAVHEYPGLWFFVDDRPFPGPQLTGSHGPPPKLMLGKVRGCANPEGGTGVIGVESKCGGKKSLL